MDKVDGHHWTPANRKSTLIAGFSNADRGDVRARRHIWIWCRPSVLKKSCTEISALVTRRTSSRRRITRKARGFSRTCLIAWSTSVTNSSGPGCVAHTIERHPRHPPLPLGGCSAGNSFGMKSGNNASFSLFPEEPASGLLSYSSSRASMIAFSSFFGAAIWARAGADRALRRKRLVGDRRRAAALQQSSNLVTVIHNTPETWTMAVS